VKFCLENCSDSEKTLAVKSFSEHSDFYP